MIATLQAPDGASVNVTNAAVNQLEDVALRDPNVDHVVSVSGEGLGGGGSNQGFAFIALKPWAQRGGNANSGAGIAAPIAPKLMLIPQASVHVFSPPSIPGLGITGGFDFELEDYLSGPLPL